MGLVVSSLAWETRHFVTRFAGSFHTLDNQFQAILVQFISCDNMSVSVEVVAKTSEVNRKNDALLPSPLK